VDLHTLALVWFALLGVLLGGYAVLDGFDLGVGTMHFLVARDEAERKATLATIGPLWDGNEVWFVTFGGAMFAAFPEAYASLFSGLYTVCMLLLFALLLRAVSIEFRSKRPGAGWRRLWDVCFSASSTLAAFVFGVAVGNVLPGLPLNARGDFTGRLGDLLNPYSIGVGLMVVALFAMHGALFLQLKTEGALRARARRWSGVSCVAFVTLLLGTTAATLATIPVATANLHRQPLLWGVPVLTLLLVANVPRAVLRGHAGQAFVSSTGVILGLVSLLGITLYPNIVPATDPAHSLAIVAAASSPRTLRIMLVIVAIGMPLVLAYTSLVYRTFRGRVRSGEAGY
jgi:cytochrome d ubiquinol oxidase subunit II